MEVLIKMARCNLQNYRNEIALRFFSVKKTFSLNLGLTLLFLCWNGRAEIIENFKNLSRFEIKDQQNRKQNLEIDPATGKTLFQLDKRHKFISGVECQEKLEGTSRI